MNDITHFLTEDHDHCDGLLAETESAVAAADWAAAGERFAGFEQATLRHFAREEAILFPAFESHTGMTGGPTAVMREEHAQMRNALSELASAIERRDVQSYLGLSETLLMLMRQHNLKEERILYPMADQRLPDRQALVARMAELRD